MGMWQSQPIQGSYSATPSLYLPVRSRPQRLPVSSAHFAAKWNGVAEMRLRQIDGDAQFNLNVSALVGTAIGQNLARHAQALQ